MNILGASRDSLVLIYVPELQDGDSMKTKQTKIHSKASTLLADTPLVVSSRFTHVCVSVRVCTIN